MKRVSRRKRIGRFSGKWDTAEMPLDRQTIGSLLVNEVLHDVRQYGRGKRARQEMGSKAVFAFAPCTCQQPTESSESNKNMLVRSPSQYFGATLNPTIGMRSDLSRDLFVNVGRMNGKKDHFQRL
jgi:hypothetical protein